ncbi:hypothetical protein MRX96_046053 [Rhipicephalus microplus]
MTLRAASPESRPTKKAAFLSRQLRTSTPPLCHCAPRACLRARGIFAFAFTGIRTPLLHRGGTARRAISGAGGIPATARKQSSPRGGGRSPLAPFRPGASFVARAALKTPAPDRASTRGA